MNVLDYIRERILKFLRIDNLESNPNDERLTFISDNEDIKKQNLKAYKTWYIGDSDELLNFYTNQELYGNLDNPIYNRNKQNYFWGISSIEGDIKRVHSGIPNAIVTTLVNVIGNPQVTIKNDPILNEKLEKIKEVNDVTHLINQQQMPGTLVEGYGAFKINIDKELSDHPIIQWYEAENVEFAYKCGILVGIVYKDYYEYKRQKYILLETRRILGNDSLIEYELFKLEKNNDITPVELSVVPELAGLENIVIPNFKKILGVPCKFFYDPLNKNYGRSIFAGKLDLFDDLDQILSQDSQTVRVSTPVEYYPIDMMERSKYGEPQMPKVYNRQFIAKEGVPNGDGTMDSQIQTTQPALNFEQYSANAKAKLDFILTGLLSPATMGIDIAKKDNADAQREKEKVTIMTRNNVIDRETRMLKVLYSLCLSMQEYMDTGKITIQEYDINVTFNEFANPSFETEIQTLGSAWSNGELSTERYVQMLWGDKLSEEEQAKEIAWLDNNRQQDNMQFGDLEDETPIGAINRQEEGTNESTDEVEEQVSNNDL